jgi:hypothetical protein
LQSSDLLLRLNQVRLVEFPKCSFQVSVLMAYAESDPQAQA